MQVYKFFFGALLFFLSVLSSAQTAVDIFPYQGEVPVASYSPEDWKKAVAPALQQVLVKVSGNPNIAQVAAIRSAMPKAGSMVQTFAYAHGTSKELVLHIRFSSKAIDALLQNAGHDNVVTGDDESNVPIDSAVEANNAAVDEALRLENTVPSENTAQPSTINLIVSGVNGLKDYAALLDYVHHLSGVIEADSKQTQGDRVLLVIKTNQTLDDLVEVIANENKLVSQPIAGIAGIDPAAKVLSYRWVADANAVSSVSVASNNANIVDEGTQSFAASSADNNFVAE